MAQVDKFWTSSGRVDNFEFEIMAANDIDKHVGWLKGVTGGTLTFGYDTDLKVSGSLNVSSTEFVESCVLRVWYKPTLGTESRERLLCTCFATTESMTFDKGRYSGSLTLSSMLARYIDDKLRVLFTVGKNKSYKAEFKRLIKDYCGGSAKNYVIGSNLKDKTCLKAVAYEVGKAPMEAIQGIAAALGGQVGVDAQGRLTLSQYIAPAKKSVAWTLPSGSLSVTLPGVELGDNAASVPNRVGYACTVSWKQTVYALDKKGRKQKYTSGSKKGKYKTKTEKKSKVITGRAQVASTSDTSFAKRGRWITENYSCKRDLGAKKLGSTAELNKKFAEIQAEMNKKAAAKLTAVSKTTKTYVIECYYLPLEIGQVVEFEYVSSGIKLHVRAMVQTIELTLGVGARMKVTLKHVRNV